MTTFTIHENSKQSKLLIEYLKTLSFVKINDSLTLKEKKYLKNLKNTAIDIKNNKGNIKTWQEVKDEL